MLCAGMRCSKNSNISITQQKEPIIKKFLQIITCLFLVLFPIFTIIGLGADTTSKPILKSLPSFRKIPEFLPGKTVEKTLGEMLAEANSTKMRAYRACLIVNRNLTIEAAGERCKGSLGNTFKYVPGPPYPNRNKIISYRTKLIADIENYNKQVANNYNKELKMNKDAITALTYISIITTLGLFVYLYFRRRHIDDFVYTQTKDDREYNLKLKQIELNQTIQMQAAELERYKTLELSKTQMANEHEVALKKLEFDKSIDARDFMITVTKDEREYLLKKRELDIKEGKISPSFMEIIESNSDVNLRIKK